MPNELWFIWTYFFTLHVFIKTGVRDNKDIAKIREVTGIDNTTEIAEAIQRCTNKEGKYDLDTVINVLLGKAEMSPDPISSSKVSVLVPETNDTNLVQIDVVI